MYYDRGELFTYLSPGFAAGVITGGPFGVNQSPPYVNAQACTRIRLTIMDYIPTCDPTAPTGSPIPGDATLGTSSDRQSGSIDNYLPNTGVPGVGIGAGILKGSRSSPSPFTTARTSCLTR